MKLPRNVVDAMIAGGWREAAAVWMGDGMFTLLRHGEAMLFVTIPEDDGGAR